jgi:hypothetical protein
LIPFSRRSTSASGSIANLTVFQIIHDSDPFLESSHSGDHRLYTTLGHANFSWTHLVPSSGLSHYSSSNFSADSANCPLPYRHFSSRSIHEQDPRVFDDLLFSPHTLLPRIWLVGSRQFVSRLLYPLHSVVACHGRTSHIALPAMGCYRLPNPFDLLSHMGHRSAIPYQRYMALGLM